MNLFRNKTVLLAAVLVVAAFTAYTFAGERGVWKLGKMVHHRNMLRQSVQDLEQNNNRLAQEIGRLRDDPATLEALARTKLGMIRPGEVVYIFREEEQQR